MTCWPSTLNDANTRNPIGTNHVLQPKKANSPKNKIVVAGAYVVLGWEGIETGITYPRTDD